MSESYTGIRVLNVSSDIVEQAYKEKRVGLESLDGRISRHLSQNEYVILKFENPLNSQSAITRVVGNELVLIPNEFKASSIKPRNKEQRMAFDALLNDDIKVVILTGKAGTGKAGSLDSLVYTPNGPVKMRDIKIGQLVCTPDGNTAEVKGIFPQGIKDIYRVIFTDGSYTETCDEHLWLTQTSQERDYKKPGKIRELKEIRQTLKYRNYKRNHSIPITAPVYFNDQYLAIDPYLLGALIGDGSLKNKTLSFTNQDTTIIDNCRRLIETHECELKLKRNSKIDYYIIGTYIRDHIISLGLNHTAERKFIPDLYKFNSIDNRIALLQGLMDTDGTVSKGRLSYTSISKQLAEDIVWLVQSLGGIGVITDRIPSYTYKGQKLLGKRAFTVHINLPNNIKPFRSEIKSNKYSGNTKYFPRRYIDRVEYIGKKEAQCIYIDHPDHLYLTDNFIVTHNTLLTLAAAIQKMEDQKYSRMILTRSMSWVGRHGLGALPGDVDEKFGPYLQNYMCNIECLLGGRYKNIPDLIEQYRMDFVPIQLIRGASWKDTFIIADEVQVLDYDEMVALGTRVGEGSKLVIMGDLGQRDENIAREKTGIHKLVNDERAKASPIVASIDLIKCERSEVSALFADIFER